MSVQNTETHYPDTAPNMIIIVEDDRSLAQLMSMALQREGFKVQCVHRGDEAVHAILETLPELVILDLMLPGMNGIEICRQLRPHYTGKILMLTAQEGEATQIDGFEAGADDYVVKPIKPQLLIARVKAHLRKASQEVGTDQVPLKIDLSARNVFVCGKELKLTTSEFDLLALLAAHSGETLSRQELYHKLRGIDYDGLDRSIDLRVSKLRSNLKAMGLSSEVIKTVHGKGYHFIPLDQLRSCRLPAQADE